MNKKEIIKIDMDGDVTIVSFGPETITGLSGLEQISRQLRSLITEEKPGKLIVDFTGVKFFSSQMLGLLVDIWRKLGDYGGTVLISSINPQLNRVFKITNLDKIFDFYPDRVSAIKAMTEKKL